MVSTERDSTQARRQKTGRARDELAPLEDTAAAERPVLDFIPVARRLGVADLLAAIADQSDEADRTRTIDPQVITALKASPVVRLAASAELGGVDASIGDIGRELEAIASVCASTAWVMWNHLAVFHLFVGGMGPAHRDLLRSIVEAGQTVCFPAGAGTGITGVEELDAEGNRWFRLSGVGAWGSGSRYADWAGVAFVVVDRTGERIPGADGAALDLRFTVVELNDPSVSVAPTWDGSAMRASATDEVRYDETLVPVGRCVRWFGANRAETLRTIPVIAARYREDWVGLSDLWLAWMGVGLVRAALDDAVEQARRRRSILGKKMTTHPTVQRNFGEAAALVRAAAATAEMACRSVDDRVRAGVAPSETDYLGQMALATSALDQLGQAMDLIARALGGAGLREADAFDRRRRDFAAMPLHINAHADRVHLRVGRHVLDEPQDPF